MAIKTQFSELNHNKPINIKSSSAVYIHGEDGATFYPEVSENGTLSWTNDKNLENPASVSIRGPVGPKGDKGDKGDRGEQGIQGIQGPKGERGEQGQKGDKGDRGEPGIQGAQGAKGETGAKGEKGEKGDQGIQGIQGIPGEKGEKGDTGATGAQGEPGKDGVSGKDGTSATHSWNGTTLTITSASGTSSANLKGEKGDRGEQGVQGPAGADGKAGSNGKDGTSVTVKSVSESTADGGSNVVTFSDGKTVTIKNGSKGSTGSVGKNGADGKTPVRGTDYWTEADKEEIVQQVITALGTPVFGRVDADNNIILTGELADGTYTIKYEDAEGNQTEIGTVEVGGVSYTNLADPTSEDWAVDKRLNSSAALVDATGCHTTNFFPCVKGDVIRVKGLDIRYTNSEHTQNARAFFYNAGTSNIVGTYPLSDPKILFDGVDTFIITLDGLANISGGSEEDVIKGRLSGMLFNGYTAEDVIITVNQEITE